MTFATISIIRLETKPRAIDNTLSKILLVWQDFFCFTSWMIPTHSIVADICYANFSGFRIYNLKSKY